MGKVVDRWVQRLKNKLEPIGEMTHWERLAAAFDLKQTDLIPVAPELDYWQITYAGYSHQEVYNDVDKTTDACLKTWADLRTDAIWMYVDISHQIEHFIPAEQRPEYFIHRGEKDYLLFKPIATTLDEAIALYEQRTYEKYADGSRPVTHYTPHMLQLLEFQEKMGRQEPIIVGIGTPTNYAETIVEVQRFLRWMVTEPEEKVRHYLNLCLQERLDALDFYAEFAVKNGAVFCCAWGGARTCGPHLHREGQADLPVRFLAYLRAQSVASAGSGFELGRRQGHPIRHALLRAGAVVAGVVRARGPAAERQAMRDELADYAARLPRHAGADTQYGDRVH